MPIGGAFDGRGRKARTLKNGFGDRYVTITSCPYRDFVIITSLAGGVNTECAAAVSYKARLLLAAAEAAGHALGLNQAELIIAKLANLGFGYGQKNGLRKGFF